MSQKKKHLALTVILASIAGLFTVPITSTEHMAFAENTNSRSDVFIKVNVSVFVVQSFVFVIISFSNSFFLWNKYFSWF